MDAAMRSAEVGAHSAPASFYSALEQIREARLRLQQGNERASREHMQSASKLLKPATNITPPILNVKRYAGAQVLNSKGEILGEVTAVSPDSVEVALGGWRDTWGFIDFGARRRATFPIDELAFGPPNRVGMTLVAISGHESAVASK
jgi:hypothetical protein